MTAEFRELELTGWQRAADAYHDAFGALTAQAIEPILDAVGATIATRLLDVATGPGDLAAAAAARGAHATGIDFAPAMVAQARRAHPGLDVRAGDAEELPFAAATFDAVVASFALLHLAHPEAAAREARRVLRPGGRFAFTVWALPERALAFRIVLDAIAAHGAPTPALPDGPPFFRFSDADECRRLLRDHAFADATVVEVPMIWRLPRPEALFEAFARGGVRTAALIAAQPASARAAIERAVTAAAAGFPHGELPMACVLASGTAV